MPRRANAFRRSAGGSWMALLWVSFCIVTGKGCSGPELGKVEGVVTLDGQGVNNVLVCFCPDAQSSMPGFLSRAVTDNQGRFVLHCDNGEEGALVGSHRVVVEDLQIYSVPREGAEPSPETVRRIQRLPQAYADANRTPLRREIHSGQQHITIELVKNLN